MNNRKNIISIFFLLTFLLIRVVDAHSFAHISEDDDQNHCELCEIIGTSLENTPVINNDVLEINTKSIVNCICFKANFNYHTPHYSVTFPKCIHNKPPPYFLV